MKYILFSIMMVAMLALSACASPSSVGTDQPLNADQAATIAVATLQALPSITPAPAPAPTDSFIGDAVIVAFTRVGSIYAWDDASGQSELVFPAEDVTLVSLSGDGQLIAFLRRWFDSNQCEQTALWVVERSGGNARAILSPNELRGLLDAVECQSPPVIIDKIEWLPASHLLTFSLLSDHEHSSPQGLYLADADTPETRTLVPADYSFKFVPSPDGNQVALMSTSGLGFINMDGSNWRQDVVTYPKSGVPLPGFANGVWTLDSRAFLLATYGNNGLDITHVPVNESAPQLLASNISTNRESIAFSPDGEFVGFVNGLDRTSTGQFDLPWLIQPLGAGPLAIPSRTEFGTPANLNWSPANVPYVYVKGNFYPFCPNTSPDIDVCNSILPGYATFYIIQWLEADRFLFLTREPFLLFLGRLDHTTVPIVIWPLEEWVTPQSFSAVLLTSHP